MHKVKCFECGKERHGPVLDSCPFCGGLLTVEMDLDAASGLRPYDLRKRPMGVWRYAPFLPVDETKAISLLEGGTPLYDCKNLAKAVGIKDFMSSTRGRTPPARSRTGA